MNREIKFRGKRLSDGEWEYGSLVLGNKNAPATKGRCWINPSPEYGFEVIPETVGQFVGRQDINGKDVYEADFLTTPPDDILGIRYAPLEVKFGSFGDYGKYTGWDVPKDCEIIGNRFDNKDLLTQEPTHANKKENV